MINLYAAPATDMFAALPAYSKTQQRWIRTVVVEAFHHIPLAATHGRAGEINGVKK
ncbi:hypothetical protein [Massilia pseudoviolaceinigra]|uniref:hypothetical protein n=1 Tax=Massilia pseudoviolaceinigra TaxID=3057165 RepID=UPI002796D3F6|nr:hypothetical protein [Massilia sp. CCM 9206]MDQ1919633.1 hypothetical protein [Massilia sp. CCM 9206]